MIDGRVVEPEYLTKGKAVHAALAAYYHPDPRSRPMDWPTDDFARYAIDQYYREAGLDPDTSSEEEDELAAYTGKLVKAYLEREAPVDDFTVTGVETAFQAVLGEVCWKCGTPYDAERYTKQKHGVWQTSKDPGKVCFKCDATIYTLVGRIDINCILNKHLAILDHKTVKSFSVDAVAAYVHSFQQIGYAYGYSKAHGVDIRTFGINFLQKLKTVGEPQSTTKQCPDCHAGKKKILTCGTCQSTGRVARETPPEPFRRVWYTIEDSMIDRYLIATIRKLRDIEAEAELLKTEPDVAYPMEESSCLGCKFQPLCYEGDVKEWYNPPNMLLEGFECRAKDYVDLASEEKY